MKRYPTHYLAASIPMLFFLAACNSGARSNTFTDTIQTTPTVVQPQNAQQLEEQQSQQKEAYKSAIASVLEQGAEIGKQHPNDYGAVASGIRQLDLSGCPRDFAVAVVDNLHAWEYADKIQQALSNLTSDDNEKRVVIKSLLEKITGSDRTSLDDLADAKKVLRDELGVAYNNIDQTYNEVEKIAVAYDVALLKK